MSRVAIVTGGGTGIGRAAALALHRDGCRLVLCGRRPQPLDEVCGLIGEAECVVLAGDIREPDVADALVDLALERFGRIDVLVNNAGGQFMAPAEEITPNGWEAVRRLNLDAPWYLTQQVAKRWMIANGGGRIISVVLCWNEYFFAALLTSTNAKTLPVMVASQTGSQGISWWSMAALSTAAIAPLVVIGVFLERYIVKGLTAGAVK